jgi:phytoene/squalene synthetase
MIDLYTQTTLDCSKIITQHYSTSFTLGIKTLAAKYHGAIYSIYAYVRYADEIVDTFHEHNKTELLSRFKQDTFVAIKEKISLNPVLHSFQLVVNQYNIDHSLIIAFLHSMEMDLAQQTFTEETYQEYIYGSAEVVGLMCLNVFCDGDVNEYQKLESSAKSLGAAFQKVNFLRDIKSDFDVRGRIYFPGVDFSNFSEKDKSIIESDIAKDFEDALVGIKNLPKGARGGVYLAYAYYLQLFKKIKKLPSTSIQLERIRVPDYVKMTLLAKTLFLDRLNYIA